MASKFSLASSLLLQSPPGELNDVFTDLRSLISSDQELESQILPALKQYNLEQFTVVEFPEGRKKKGLVCRDARGESEGEEGEEEKFVDWREGKAFGFNHMTATASKFEEIEEKDMFDQETLDKVEQLDELLNKYTENHYSEGVSRVYPLEDERHPRETQSQESQVEPEPAKEQEETVQDDALVPEKEETDKSVASVAAEVGEVAEEVIKEGVEGDQAASMEVSTPAPIASEEKTGEEAMDPMQEDKKEVEQIEEPIVESTKEEESIVPPPPAPAAPAPQPRTSRLLSLCFVGNKYNPNNYWTGRWRSRYEVDLESGSIKGTAQINIHYYEQGNVQLSTTLTSSHTLSPSPSPAQIIASVKSSETSFQVCLNQTYESMSEEAFKGLRRALPKTRSKVDWNKAGGYRLGAELGGGN